MNQKNLRRIVVVSLVAWILILVVAYQAFAATSWIKQEGTYELYKINNTNKYLPANSLEVPKNYIKQSGTYTQLKSSGGATKYELNAIVSDCSAFICKDDFGLTFDLTKNTVLDCPMVKISNEQIQVYEGLQVSGKCR